MFVCMNSWLASNLAMVPIWPLFVPFLPAASAAALSFYFLSNRRYVAGSVSLVAALGMAVWAFVHLVDLLSPL